MVEPLRERVLGRVVAEPIVDSQNNVLFERNALLDERRLIF